MLGRDRVLPAQVRPGARHATAAPYIGRLAVTAATVTIVAVSRSCSSSTRTKVLAQGAVGLATLGLVSLQAIAAVAIVRSSAAASGPDTG